MIDNKKIVAVIVTYNRLELLKECIKAIVSATIIPDIIVVNNNSSDGTKEYLDKIEGLYKNAKFHIYNMPTNLNGAGGFNYGIRKGVELNYNYIWIMDDDTIVSNDSLEELLKAKDHFNNNFSFLSSKVLWTDGSICKTNVQRVKIARRINDFESDYVKVDFASFVSLFVKADDVKRLGLPIKEFIIWTDDLEWTRRFTLKSINKKDTSAYLCNKSVVTHKTKNNFGVTIVKDTSDRIDRYKYIYRNDVYCFKREGIRGHLYMFIRNLYHIIRVLLFSKNLKMDKIITIIKGYISGYSFNPCIEYVGDKI